MRRAISADHVAEADLLQDLIRVGWGRTDPVFRRVFTSRFLPGGTPEQMAHFDELQRVSASAEMALRLRAEWNQIDVTDLLDQIEVPTLVAHARADAVVPFEEGRLLATRIPGARFLPLESQNHILMAAEPAWQVFLAAFEDFLGTAAPARIAGIDGLTDREREVLRLVAQGLSNEAIAQQLSISARTVERHLAGSYEKLDLSGRSARAAAAALITRLG